MSTPLALLFTVILLTGNAFFAGTEFAVISLRHGQPEPLAEAGDARATIALWVLQNVLHILATAQLDITLCSTGLGVAAELAVTHALKLLLAAVGVGHASFHTVTVVVILVIVMGLHIVAGEMVPEDISTASPEKAVRWLAPLLVWCSRVFGPVTNALNGFTSGILKVLGIEVKEEIVAAFNTEEVVSIVECSTAEGVLEDSTDLLSGALEFLEETAGSVMMPLNELVTLAQDCTPEDVEWAVVSTGSSHFPLVAGRAAVDQVEEPIIIDYLHLKDILYADGVEHTEPVPVWRARTLVPVSHDDEIEEALAAMQHSGAHLGHVHDAQGRFVGVLFPEGILGEPVGEVDDAMQREKHRRRD